MSTVLISYSVEQVNAHIDSCLYGWPYGMQTGEYEHIEECLKDLALPTKYAKHEMDDAAYKHIITY